MKPPEIFQTTRLILRKPVQEDDVNIFSTYAQNPKVTEYLTWVPHTDISVTRQVVKSFIHSWETGDEFPFVIESKDNKELMGMITIRIDALHGANFGYVLAEEYWGNGYMTEALREVLAWLMDQENIYRVWAFHDIDNPASGKVMEKVGMQCEGVMRKWSIHPNISDKPRDCRCYSIVK